jgi:hypothetical protein
MCSRCARETVNGQGGTGGPGGGSTATPVAAGRLPGPLLRRRAARRPDGLPYEHWDCGYRELDRRARAVAARLGRTLPPGSRVLLAFPYGVDLAGALFGCLYAGMTAVPLVSTGSPAESGTIAEAVRRCRPGAVLTASDAWTALAIDHSTTEVYEADGHRVGGEPVRRLAVSWRPVGVLRTAAAYQRYVPGAVGPGRLEPPVRHSDLADILGELGYALRRGTPDDSLGWIASIHGLEDALWRLLLPVHEDHPLPSPA